MKIRYEPVFALGGFGHSITVYEEWTAEKGLETPIASFSHPRKDKVLKEVKEYLSYPQLEKLKQAMSYRDRGSWDEHGIPIR